MELLWELAARFPVPEERWHAHVPAMRRCVRDFRAAIQAVQADLWAAAALDRIIEDGKEPAVPSGLVAEALGRLDELPAPEGEHPFIGEILPTLAAMRAALYAVAASADAMREFAAAE